MQSSSKGRHATTHATTSWTSASHPRIEYTWCTHGYPETFLATAKLGRCHHVWNCHWSQGELRWSPCHPPARWLAIRTTTWGRSPSPASIRVFIFFASFAGLRDVSRLEYVILRDALITTLTTTDSEVHHHTIVLLPWYVNPRRQVSFHTSVQPNVGLIYTWHRNGFRHQLCLEVRLWFSKYSFIKYVGAFTTR